MYKQILDKIKEYDTIIIHRHNRPDGDALGSQIGLKEALKLNFPEKRIFAVGDESDRLGFIGQMDKISDDEYNDSLVIVLDTAEPPLISDERYQKGKFIIKIDHHISRNEYGDLNLVDTSFESCAGLIAHFLIETNLQIDTSSAKPLFTGIVTDSGRFRYDSTTSRTFEIVARLLKEDFAITDIYNELYLDDLELVRLKAHFMLNFNLTENNVAYMKNTNDDIIRFNTNFFTMSRGMVNTMAGIRGIPIWVNFTEDIENNVVVAEIRSNKYNINEIAVKYGGGGHKFASGASLASWEEADQMLKDLDNIVKEANDAR